MQNLLCGLTGLFMLAALTTQGDESASELVKKAIKAHGGAANVAKLKTRREKSKNAFEARGQNVTSASDSLIKLPGQRKDTLEHETGNKKITSSLVINGAKAWSHRNGETREYTGELQKMMAERVHREYLTTLTPLLDDRGLTLSVIGEAKVGERPAIGVRVVAKDHWDVNLFFDKESGLLVKSSGRIVQVKNQEADLEIFYSAHKETEGVKWHTKAVQYLEGKKTDETEITELRFLPKIDDGEFRKP